METSRADAHRDPAFATQWVEIEWTVLTPEQRAANVPEDTARVEYVARCRGYVDGPPEIGDEVEIMTKTGRRLQGRVVSLHPGHHHSFGNPVPAWLAMQYQIRMLVNGEGDL